LSPNYPKNGFPEVPMEETGMDPLPNHKEMDGFVVE
jgi:hypothetical protein